MQKQFLKQIYYTGDIYTFWSCKDGVLVDVNDKVSCNPHNNIREATRWVEEYSEFGLGKHILKNSESYADSYVADEELRYLSKDISCKNYNFDKKECEVQNEECYMCNDYRV